LQFDGCKVPRGKVKEWNWREFGGARVPGGGGKSKNVNRQQKKNKRGRREIGKLDAGKKRVDKKS